MIYFSLGSKCVLCILSLQVFNFGVKVDKYENENEVGFNLFFSGRLTAFSIRSLSSNILILNKRLSFLCKINSNNGNVPPASLDTGMLEMQVDGMMAICCVFQLGTFAHPGVIYRNAKPRDAANCLHRRFAHEVEKVLPVL
jgi:hypothetical protein